MRRLVPLVVLLAALASSGCSDDTPQEQPATTPPVETPEEPAVPAGPNQVGSGGGFGG